MSLKNDVAQVGNFQLVLNEYMIAKATKLPQTGECWFKGERVNKKKNVNCSFYHYQRVQISKMAFLLSFSDHSGELALIF